jgi:hypothetical protein
MTWADHVAGMGEKKNDYGSLIGNSERKKPLENLGIHAVIML